MAEQNSNPGGKKQSEGLQTLVKAERLTQIAFVLPAAVLVGWGAGALLDKWLHQDWIYIVGLILGAVAGMVEAVRQALRANAQANDDMTEAIHSGLYGRRPEGYLASRDQAYRDSGVLRLFCAVCAAGWKTGALFVAGAVVSATGLYGGIGQLGSSTRSSITSRHRARRDLPSPCFFFVRVLRRQ